MSGECDKCGEHALECKCDVSDKDYIKHIAISTSEGKKSICKQEPIYEWSFESIDHAYLSIKSGSSVIPCYDCITEITNTFDNIW